MKKNVLIAGIIGGLILLISITSMGAYSYFAFSEATYGTDGDSKEPISKIAIKYIKK